MLYLRRTFLSVVCTALLGCAVGVSDDTELPFDDLVQDTGVTAIGNPAFFPDAGSPLIQSPPSSAPASSWPVAVAQDAGAPGSITLVPPSVMDAGSASPASDAGIRPLDAATPGTLDSGAANGGATSNTSRDASPPPVVSEPICEPLKCNNNCGLLPRCCNEDNECACRSLIFRTCSLRSL